MSILAGRRQASRASFLYLCEINETPLLSATEERALAERIAQGDPSARDHLVRANLRLVVNIARGYLGKGLAIDDLVSEGNLGLMRAVEGFDGAAGVRFSTYASYWIKQSIRSALMKTGKPIRLPAYMVTLLSKWHRVRRHLAGHLGREPLPEEVGRALGLSKRKLGMAMQALEVANLTPHGEDLAAASQGVLRERLADERTRSPADQLIESDELERVFEHLDGLSEREARVIRMRFGLDPYSAMTLREVGEALELTRERVRQIEREALGRLIADSEASAGE